ncbi:MAG TPA: 1,4-dihydroxy-2-naphthoate octaprenyltransferase [Thermomicrobiales bacterium]|nr:1,4-dihydroxy-2-naphthoate octaprenyltransferase [Thermomicrobiales bacterium]
MTNARRWLTFILTILGPVLVLLIWEVLSRTETINPIFFPPPSSLEETARELIRSGQLWDDTRMSLQRILLGFAAASVPGVLLGLLMGLWWPLRALLSPIAAALFAVPKIAVLPLVILVFGLDEDSKVAMVAISVFFMVVINTAAAVMAVEKAYFDVARNAGAPWWKQITTVALPGALPAIFSGLRLALGFSLLVIVGTEMLASGDGIGYMIWNSYQRFSFETMYIGLIVTALLGWLLSLVMDGVERIIMPWRVEQSSRLQLPVPDAVYNWWMATRPFSFTASIVPVLVGTLLAAYEGHFDFTMFVLVIVASVLVHAGSNLVNDYYDHVKGADAPHQLGRGGMIQRGLISPRAIFIYGLALFAIATVIGFYIVYLVGWPVLLFALPSLAAAYLYTGGPKPLGYVALGEVTVFIFMGPVIVAGSYYVQTGAVSWEAVLVSLPIGLLVTAILQANNIRDIDDDLAANKRTLATFIGHRWAVREYVVLLLGSYVVLGALTLGGAIPLGALLVFLTLPKAIELIRVVRYRTSAAALNLLLRKTAGLHLQFGTLLAGVLLVAAVFAS